MHMAATGNRGKFSERIKNILKFKRRKRKPEVNENIEYLDSNKIYIDFLKVMAAIPGFVRGTLSDGVKEKPNVLTTKKVTVTVEFKDEGKQVFKDESKPELESLDKQISKVDDNLVLGVSDKQPLKEEHFIVKDINPKDEYQLKSFKDDNVPKKDSVPAAQKTSIRDNKSHIKSENRKKINAIDLTKIKKAQEKFAIDKTPRVTPTITKKIGKDINKEDVNKYKECQKLEKTIIDIIKKRLIKTVNELEILQSELYILSEVNGESKVANECKEELDQIKSILCKIDKLKEQYDFLKDNYDFEYLLEIDDNNLVDKIIELKNTFGNNELKAVSVDYKLLDVYKYLYLKIDDMEEKTAKFEDEKQKELARLKERDIDFEKLKSDVYNVKAVNSGYEQFVASQAELIRKIDEDVSKINHYERVDYHLKGFGELFRNSFKYFGLLMVSPLKGIIPSIATETLLTGNLIKNLYRNLEWEESRKMVYEAVDYTSMLSSAINDLDGTNRIVDATLDDIVHLKMQYNEKFKKYQGDFLEYRDIMRKISDMENKILGNKIKIEMMRQRALEQQRINDKKMVLVKKLNEERKS